MKVSANTAVILDMHGKPLPPSSLSKYQNSGLSNGAADIKNPSLQGWNWWGSDPDGDIVEYLDIVRQRCRDLVLNAPIVAGMLNTMVTQIIGQGLKPEPTPDAELLGMTQEQAQAWKQQVIRCLDMVLESKDIDIRRRDNFYELTQLVLRSALESGDVFVALPMTERKGTLIDLRVQLIEADSVSNRQWSVPSDETVGDVFGGVEVDEHGEVIAYHVATRHPLSKRRPFIIGGKMHHHGNQWVRVPVYGDETGRRNMLHIMRSQRPGQRRGIPILAPIVEATKIADRYMKAELQAALVQALFTAYVESQSPDAALGEFNAISDELGTGKMSREEFYSSSTNLNMGAGTIGFLYQGDSIKPVGATRPYSGFAPFMEFLLKMIGSPVGMPYELLMMHFQSSFSASRAAMNVARSGFKVLQDWIVTDFCRPVYDEIITLLVADGHIQAPGFFENPLLRQAYCSAKWSGPGAIQIDPGAEVDAAIKRASVGISTYQQETAEMNGGDWMINASERHLEQRVFDSAPWDPTLTKVGTPDTLTGDSTVTGGDVSAENQ